MKDEIGKREIEGPLVLPRKCVRARVCIHALVACYKITYSVATLSYDNYYVNLRNYSNSLLSGLL